MTDLTIFNHFTHDELLDANERARRHVGKRLELCTHDDLDTIHAAILDEIEVAQIARVTALADIEAIIERAKRRAGREGAFGSRRPSPLPDWHR